MAKPRVPKSLFSKGLDEVATRWLKNTAPADEQLIRRLTALQGLAAMEALVFAPRVSFKVYGENVVLAILSNALGVGPMEDLLRSGDVEFILWRSFPVQLQKAELQPGLTPLAGLTLTDKAHSDPLESSELGLRGWGKELSEADGKRLAKFAADRTIVVAEDLGDKAVQRLVHAYESGLLTARGFDSGRDMASLSLDRRTELATMAESFAEGVVAFEGEYDFHEGATTWNTLVDAVARVRGQTGVIESVESVLELERMPSIPDLLLRGVIPHTEIVSIRNRPETQEFRKWLWSQPDPASAKDVSEAYLAAMAPKVDLKDRAWFKAARISAVGIAGSVLGAVLAGPLGGVAGLAVGTAAGVAVSELDGFWGDRLLAGTNPRRFATDVLAPKMAAHQALSSRWATDARAVSVDVLQAISPQPRPRPLDKEAKRKDRNKHKAKRRAQKDSR